MPPPANWADAWHTPKTIMASIVVVTDLNATP